MGYVAGETIYAEQSYVDPSGNAIYFDGGTTPTAYIKRNGAITAVSASASAVSSIIGGWATPITIPASYINGTDIVSVVFQYTLNSNVYEDVIIQPTRLDDATAIGVVYYAITGTTTGLVTSDTQYGYNGMYNGQPSYKSTNLSTAAYLWYSPSAPAAWVITAALGTLGTGYFQATGALAPIGPYLAEGSGYAGTPSASIANIAAPVDGNGYIKSNLFAILGGILTESVSGYIAAAFKKLFNVTTPVLTAASVDQTEDVGVQVPTALTYDGNGLPKVDVVDILGTQSPAAPGYVGPDWGHVNAPTSTVALSGTTVGTVTTVAGGATSTALAALVTTVGVAGAGLTGLPAVQVGSYASGKDPATLLLTNPTHLIVTDNSGHVQANVMSYASGQDPASWVWNTADASIFTTADTMGLIVNEIYTAVQNITVPDPLLASVPGSYSSGTAGYAIGHGATSINAALQTVLEIQQGDLVINMDASPPTHTVFAQGTDTALVTRKLRDVDGNPIVSITTIAASATQS
jgi:hypothetical protein